MATPTKSEILEKAIAIYQKEQWQNGTQISITPTEQELKEGHYFETARQILMCSNPNVVLIEREARSRKSESKETKFLFDVSEALQNGTYTCGTKGTGKSDVNMIIAEKLHKENVTVAVFDPSQDWMKRSNIAKYITVKPNSIIEVPKESVIYDISLLTPIQQQKIVEDFNRKLFDYQARVSNVLRNWFFVIFEEAHQYFRQGCMRAKNLQFSIRLLTQGRNFKIAVGMVTQFSSLIDKEAMKFMLQRYFGTTNEPNDIAYLKGFLGEHAEQLKTLKNGEFLYYNRGNVRRIQIKPYQAESLPILLEVSQSLSEPQPIYRKQLDSFGITKLLIAMLWFVAILLGLSQMGW